MLTVQALTCSYNPQACLLYIPLHSDNNFAVAPKDPQRLAKPSSQQQRSRPPSASRYQPKEQQVKFMYTIAKPYHGIKKLRAKWCVSQRKLCTRWSLLCINLLFILALTHFNRNLLLHPLLHRKTVSPPRRFGRRRLHSSLHNHRLANLCLLGLHLSNRWRCICCIWEFWTNSYSNYTAYN